MMVMSSRSAHYHHRDTSLAVLPVIPRHVSDAIELPAMSEASPLQHTVKNHYPTWDIAGPYPTWDNQYSMWDNHCPTWDKLKYLMWYIDDPTWDINYLPGDNQFSS